MKPHEPAPSVYISTIQKKGISRLEVKKTTHTHLQIYSASFPGIKAVLGIMQNVLPTPDTLFHDSLNQTAYLCIRKADTNNTLPPLGSRAFCAGTIEGPFSVQQICVLLKSVVGGLRTLLKCSLRLRRFEYQVHA